MAKATDGKDHASRHGKGRIDVPAKAAQVLSIDRRIVGREQRMCCIRSVCDGFSGGNPEKQFSEKAGLYRSRDGGKKWTRLSKGLPDRPMGRCGIDVYRKDGHGSPNISGDH